MKRLVFLILCIMVGIELMAQDKPATMVLGQDNPNAVYRLYPTTNMWTFLKLNTQDGRIWQVQWSQGPDTRFETFLNATPLAFGEEKKNGRFTLYPTTNMWTFILLDTITGNTWQVQWSQKPEGRMVIQISKGF